MQFDSTISLTLPGGQVITGQDLDTVYMDHPRRKVVLVKFHPALAPVVLWRGPAYDAIGDWTESQAEARINELLAEKPNLLASLVLP